VFGEALPRIPVSSCKGQLGHTLNAAGALEALATVLALHDGVLPPTANFRVPDPECAPLDCIPNAARRQSVDVALCNSFAFGGLNAVLALRRAA
jgi:nodulation protein E